MSAANHKYIFDKQTLTLVARKVILLRSDFFPIPSNPSRNNSIKLYMLFFRNPEDPRDQRDSLFSRILENFFSSSLLILDLEPFQFHFHFSKKSEGILFFTFHFSTKVKAIRISLFFSREKRVKYG